MAYKYRHFIPQNTAPNGATSIGVYKDGVKVTDIPLGRMTPQTKTPTYSFGLVSDLHLYGSTTAWNGNNKFDAALAYFNSIGCAFCIHCGDITDSGFYNYSTKERDLTQFAKYKEIRDKYPNFPVYGICGNHESITGIPITNDLTDLEYYTGNDLYYTVSQGNDLFILVGQPTYNKVMSDDALTWLGDTLADNTDKRCFVFVHSYIEEDSGDAVDYRENSVFDDWGTTKTNAFINLLRQYPNVVLFHGHSHMEFECQEYDVNANYTERNGFKSVHIPSVGKPRYIGVASDGTLTGETPTDNAGSQGYVVDVYDDCIVLNGMDFVNNEYVPLGVYKIDT